MCSLIPFYLSVYKIYKSIRSLIENCTLLKEKGENNSTHYHNEHRVPYSYGMVMVSASCYNEGCLFWEAKGYVCLNKKKKREILMSR